MMAISVTGTSKFSADFLRGKKNGKPYRCVCVGGGGRGDRGEERVATVFFGLCVSETTQYSQFHIFYILLAQSLNYQGSIHNSV